MELVTVLAIEALWEQLAMGPTLNAIEQRAGCFVSYERALLAMVANRLCEPESKLGVRDRWLQQVYLPSCDRLKLAQMYEAMDLLATHSSEVEEAIFFQTASLLDLAVDVVFYDTTTVSFSIDASDEETDDIESSDALRQMVVALAVTREGLPVRS